MAPAPSQGLCPSVVPGQQALAAAFSAWTPGQPTLLEASALGHFPGPIVLLGEAFSTTKASGLKTKAIKLPMGLSHSEVEKSGM